MSSTVAQNPLSKNLKRLLKDVRNIIKNPLTNHGIHYVHDTDNCFMGYAMIIGPSDTLYRHGFYFFKFSFSNEYPYVPPVVTYLTNGENIRFNPNLYRNGKVCLSVLNTWRGEGWTSCQNISSILLTIVSHVFNNQPLLNEPGVTIKHPSFKSYHDIVRWGNYKVALHDVVKNSVLPTSKYFETFDVFIKEYLKNNFNDIMTDLNELEKNNKSLWITTTIYGMKSHVDYKELKTSIQKLFNDKKLN